MLVLPRLTMRLEYVSMLKYDKYSAQGRQREMTGIVTHLKAMAKEMQIPILLLTHLPRNVEDRPGGKAKLDDLNFFESYSHDADIVLILRGPGRYKDDVFLRLRESRHPGCREEPERANWRIIPEIHGRMRTL
jgi:replicative DNA helicase